MCVCSCLCVYVLGINIHTHVTVIREAINLKENKEGVYGYMGGFREKKGKKKIIYIIHNIYYNYIRYIIIMSNKNYFKMKHISQSGPMICTALLRVALHAEFLKKIYRS